MQTKKHTDLLLQLPRVCWKVKVLVTQSCLTLCNSMDCSPPGSSLHGILQARKLEWITIPFSREPSRPKDWTWVSCIAGRFFTFWVTRKTPKACYYSFFTEEECELQRGRINCSSSHSWKMAKTSFDLEPSDPNPSAWSSPRSFFPAKIRGNEQGMVTSAR